MKIDINNKHFYEFDKPEFDDRTKNRLIQISKLGMTEVGVAEFGISDIISGLYIERIWSLSEVEWNSYIKWVTDLIETKEMQIESEIIQLLEKDNSHNCTVHFRHTEDCLSILTYNPHNKQVFLLCPMIGDSKYERFKNGLEYIKNTLKDEKSWTVKWKDIKNIEHVSYFYGSSKEEVELKWSTPEKYATLISINENPIS